MLLERDNIVAQLDRLAGESLIGRGSVAFVVGEAGIGKKNVLRAVAERLADRLRLLWWAYEDRSTAEALTLLRELSVVNGDALDHATDSGSRLAPRCSNAMIRAKILSTSSAMPSNCNLPEKLRRRSSGSNARWKSLPRPATGCARAMACAFSRAPLPQRGARPCRANWHASDRDAHSLRGNAEIALAYANLAHLAMLTDDTTEAVRWSERGIPIALQLARDDILATVFNNYGTAIQYENFDRGMDLLGMAIPNRSSLNCAHMENGTETPRFVSLALIVAERTWTESHACDDALALLESAAALASSTGSPWDRGTIWVWQRRLGASVSPPAGMTVGYAELASGDIAGAVAACQAHVMPFDKAMADHGR